MLVGRMCVYTPVHDHLEIVYIRVLVFCRDDSSVENWMHQYACMQYANESHSKSQSIVFRLKFTRKKQKQEEIFTVRSSEHPVLKYFDCACLISSINLSAGQALSYSHWTYHWFPLWCEDLQRRERE